MVLLFVYDDEKDAGSVSKIIKKFGLMIKYFSFHVK